MKSYPDEGDELLVGVLVSPAERAEQRGGVRGGQVNLCLQRPFSQLAFHWFFILTQILSSVGRAFPFILIYLSILSYLIT